jgi:hypothetical protein
MLWLDNQLELARSGFELCSHSVFFMTLEGRGYAQATVRGNRRFCGLRLKGD